MKKALVLAGGGTRGAYQCGAIRALRHIQQDDWDIVTGTSIGALNGALVVQGDYKAMDDLWHNLTQETIIKGGIPNDINIDTILNEQHLISSFFKNYIKERGADISPFIEKASELYNAERFLASPIEFGCITVRHGANEPVYVTKEMMKEHGLDWLMASASAFPAFPIYKFEEGEFVDGGYFDNFPIDYALRLGATEVIAIDLNNEPQHPNYFGHKHIHYIYPHKDLGSFLNFNREQLDKMEIYGYNDALKEMGFYQGVLYTFEKEPLPKFYDELIRQILMLETRIKLATNINESLRSETVVYDTVSQRLKKKKIRESELYFGLMDILMDLCNLDDCAVWTYEKARNAILAQFAPCAQEDYPYLPTKSPKDMVAYASSLDTKGIISKMVHTNLYPDHVFLSEGAWLTLYPFEEALALLVTMMMFELGGF